MQIQLFSLWAVIVELVIIPTTAPPAARFRFNFFVRFLGTHCCVWRGGRSSPSPGYCNQVKEEKTPVEVMVGKEEWEKSHLSIPPHPPIAPPSIPPPPPTPSATHHEMPPNS